MASLLPSFCSHAKFEKIGRKSMSSAPKDAGYILGYSEEEHARLELQAEGLERGTRSALHKVGVAAGWKCLDVACGTASVTRILGGLVGASGAVHAIDLDETYGQPAIDRLNSAGPRIFSFEKFDVAGDAKPKGAPFDLVFARLLILHMANPVKAIQNMWSWVKPGGVLLIQDYDMEVATTFTDGGKAADLAVIIRKIFSAMGKDYRAGASMPRKFLQAGIGTCDGIDVYAKFNPGKENIERGSLVVRSLQAVAVKFGVATNSEIESLLAAASFETQEPNAIGRWPDLVSTWKRKPA
jgi:ubiquinone/menaquinone biosynthesis C-methylase UbiE